jgi:hypothetical protein
MNLRSSLRTLAFASVCALPLPAGVVTINFTETGGNVIVTASGSLTDATAWTFAQSGSALSEVSPIIGLVSFSGPSAATGNAYSASKPNTGTWTGGLGSGSQALATSSSGNIFGFFAPAALVNVPTGYSFSSPTNLSSTMTFTGTTIAGLGITPTAKSAIYGNDTIQLTFGGGGGSSVPDAGPGPALALLLGGLGLRQWHSSRRSRATA